MGVWEWRNSSHLHINFSPVHPTFWFVRTQHPPTPTPGSCFGNHPSFWIDSVISAMMDWNPKTPSLWDLENLVLFNGKACETPNQLTPTEDWGIDIGSSSKSSISVDDAEKKAPQFSFQTIEGRPKDFRKNNDLGASGEPLTGLKLGRRTYLEDVSSSPPTNSAKKSRASCICQVEGCNVDLTGAKDYHRKHRVCESHSKCPKVIVSGLERRFCQQCSRWLSY